MKKLLALSLALGFVLTACSTGAKPPAPTPGGSDPAPASASGAGEETFHFQFASVAPEGSALMYACEQFCDKVTERTGGNVTFDIYPNSQLGNGMEYTQQMMEGNIAMGTIANDTLASYWSEFNVFNAPFVFNDRSECDAICDGEIGEALWQVLEKDNLHVLSNVTTYNGSGFRLVTANKEIRTPEDMKNLKIRVMENQILLAGWQALHTNPTPVSFTEVFTSLQQGAVEAQENPMDLIYGMKFYEVQKYIILTNHLLQPAPIVINADIWAGIPEEYQTIMEEEAHNAALYERELGAELEAQYRTEIEATGVTYVELTDAEREAFRAQMGPVYQLVLESAGPIAEDFFDALDIEVG